MKNPVIRSTSTWDAPGIEQFLVGAKIPVRLSCLSRNGIPLICSLWYLYDGEMIWCATQRTAQLAKLLRLIDRYLQRRDSAFAKWLLARQDQEVAVRIEPIWLTSWDYSPRMSV